jgi:hypothetical protein
LTHRGEFLDSAPGAKSLDNWRWALLNEVIIAPIDPHARPGDAWRSPALAALPNVRLEPAATTRAATGCFRFAGAATLDGHDCFVLTKTTDTPLDDLRPQSLIDSRHADLIDQSRVRLRAGRQISRTQTWIDRHTRLPRKTVLQSSAVLWLSNRAEPDPFVSDHDYEVHEFRTDSAHVLVIGRLLAAEFE